MASQELTIAAPRLPYHPAIEERFGVSKSSWKALVEAVYPGAKTVDSVIMVLSYCKARRLDPFKRPVHIVPVWSAAAKGMVDTVWPGISEQRTTAMRTGLYAGCEEVDFGPDITETWTWTEDDRRGTSTDKSATVTFPEWARMTLYRMVGGVRVPVVGPKVYWMETYATQSRWTPAPNEMWRKRPRGQLEKCAEAAALRRAFPEELGDEPTAEEMEGGQLYGHHAGPQLPPPTLHTGFPEPQESPRTAEAIAPSDDSGHASEGHSASTGADEGRDQEAGEVRAAPKATKPRASRAKPPAQAPEPEPPPPEDTFPGDLPPPLQTQSGHNPEDEGEPIQDAEFAEVGEEAGFIDEPAVVTKIRDLNSWEEILAALRENGQTAEWQNATNEERDFVREQAFDCYLGLKERDIAVPPLTSSFGLMRMWLEFGEIDSVEILNQAWRIFYGGEVYRSAKEEDQKMMTALKVRRARELGA